jgi:hypothetical protein
MPTIDPWTMNRSPKFNSSIISADDPAVAEMIQRIRELLAVSTHSDRASSSVKATDRINLVLAHGMFRLGTRACERSLHHSILDHCAQSLLRTTILLH